VRKGRCRKERMEEKGRKNSWGKGRKAGDESAKRLIFG
jgi:hypothetical protein